MKFLYFFVCYLLIINATGFLLMLIDKKKAQKRKRRIPEMTLMMVAVAGGSIGSLIGMYTVRHKTQKKKFTLGIPAIFVLQLYISFYLLYQLI